MEIVESFLQNQKFLVSTSVYLATWTGAIFLLFHLIKLGWTTVQGFRLYVLSQCFNWGDSLKKYGQWVVVVGGTDGIGLAMCKNLARRGHSILVIGRNEQRLAATKEMLEKEPIRGEVVTARIDLANASEADYARIRTEIDPHGRDIGILLNCAGTVEHQLLRYHATDMDFIQRQVNVQIMGPLYFTRMILPGMVERQRGLVVNFSSQLSLVALPYFGVYSPTKAFINLFSKALQAEYSDYPIDVVNLTIGPVVSKMLGALSAYNTSTLFTPMPDQYARSCLNALATGIGSISGYWMHGLMYESLQRLVYFNLEPILVKINLMFNSIDISQLTPKMARKVLVVNQNKKLHSTLIGTQ